VIQAEDKAPQQAPAEKRNLPPDLRTRKTGDDWPAFLGPTGDSKSTEKGLVTPWPEKGPRIVWYTQLGTGYPIPAISRGRLFHFARYDDMARLTCLNSETGGFLWKFEYPTNYRDLYGYNNGPRCQPVIDEDRVYIHGVEGMLHCLRAVDGQEVWSVDTFKKFGVIKNFFGVGSVPVIEGNLLIVQVGGSPPESQMVPPGQLNRVKSNGSGVVAFDKLTGEVKYQIGDELASYASPVLATIGGRRWCFVFARGGLLAFEPKSGEIDFHYPWRATIMESVNASNPVVVDDLVLISETYGPGSSLLKVRPKGYDVVWSDVERRRDKSLQTHWNTPVHLDGYVYASSGRHTENGELRCVELKTGKVMWSEPRLGRCSLLYVDGHLICQAEGGELLLIKANPAKYELVSEVSLIDSRPGPIAPELLDRPLLEYPAWTAPILSHGLLYVRGNDRLVCLEVIPQKK
jgi:outer membrane protein assembly factor BamB